MNDSLARVRELTAKLLDDELTASEAEELQDLLRGDHVPGMLVRDRDFEFAGRPEPKTELAVDIIHRDPNIGDQLIAAAKPDLHRRRDATTREIKIELRITIEVRREH